MFIEKKNVYRTHSKDSKYYMHGALNVCNIIRSFKEVEELQKWEAGGVS